MKCDEDSGKWIFCTNPISGPFDHFVQEWILIKISDNQALLANNSKYNEQITPEMIQKISEQKKFTFDLIEEILNSEDNKYENKIINKFKEGKNCFKDK